jgi:hypothetical protein
MALNNKIRVTNFAAVNSTNFPTRSSVTNPSDWSTAKGPQGVTGSATGTFIATGYKSTDVGITKILRTTDFVTWSEITTPAVKYGSNNGEYTRQIATNQSGTWIIVSGSVGSGFTDNKSIVSTDDGATWSSGGNLPSTSVWTSVTFGIGSTYMAFRSTNAAITTNNGTSWAAVTSHSMGFPHCVYGNGRWLLLDNNSGTSVQHSDNNGTSWSVTRSCPQFSKILYLNGKFIGLGVPSASVPGSLYVSSDAGLTWSAVATFNTGGNIEGVLLSNGRYYLLHTTTIYSSTDLIKWNKVTELTGDSNVVNTSQDVLNSYYMPYRPQESTLLDYIPVYVSNGSTGIYYSKGTPTINNGNSSYIDVTTSKGSLSKVIRVPVVKNSVPTQFNSMSVYPSSYTLASTVDGVVAADAFTNANITVTCYTDGIDTTASWTLSKSDSTGLSTTLTGSNIKINSLATANDTATCTVTASNTTTGKALSNIITITKNKNSNYSGINRGASFSAYSTTQTAVYLKFLTTGYFQIKYGAAGVYANAGQWYTPVNVASPAGGSYYMIMEYTSFTGDTLTGGTNGVVGGSTWNQMNVDREYYLSNAASGRHVIIVNPRLATSNTGANANVGNGTLELNVP